jgi:hypothetical protein
MKAVKIAFSVALAGMMVLGIFAGCISKEQAKAVDLQAAAHPENWVSQTKDIGESAFVASDPLAVVLLSSASMHNGKNHPVLYPGSEVLGLYTNKIGTDSSASSKLSTDSSNMSIELAKMCWEKSDGAFLVSDYKSALVAAPFASMVSAPVFYADGSSINAVSEAMKSLGVKEVIVIGNAPAPKEIAFEVRSASDVNVKYIKTASALGKPIDYIIAANPNDVVIQDAVESKPFAVTGTMSGIMKAPPVVGGDPIEYQTGNTPLEFEVPAGYARITVDFKQDSQNMQGDDYVANIDVYLYNPAGEVIKIFHDFSGATRKETFVIKDMPGKWTAQPMVIIAVNTNYELKATVDSINGSWHPSIANLSASAAALAVYRHAIILADEKFGMDEPFASRPQESLTCGGRMLNSSVEDANMHVGVIRDAVNETVALMVANGMGPKAAGGPADVTYLALVGGPREIPFMYYWFYYEAVNGALADFTPYDAIYADVVDSDEFTYELAVGRFVSRNLGDSLDIVGREMNYAKLIEQAYGPLAQAMAWKDTATVYAGDLLLEGNWAVILMNAQLKMQNDGGFGMVYGNYGPTANEPLVKPQIESSNFVWFHVHGAPQAIAPVGAGDVNGPAEQSAREVEKYNLGPGVVMASSCLTAKIDDMPADDCFSLAWLHAGFLSYFGATRPSLGAVTPCVGPLDMGGSNGICYMVLNNLIDSNAPMGVAVRDAKNAYVEQYGCAGTDEYTLREFVLYGDPAFNPYEPCNQS